VAKVRERPAVTEQRLHRFHMKRFNLMKLNEVEGKEQCHVEVSDRITVLENLDYKVDNNIVSETIRENIKISVEESLGYYELKKQKPWFDKGSSKLFKIIT
jgi:hypothetical protein